VRIISGTFRGLQLKVPGNLPVRPTTDFAKTGLFNILNNRYNLEETDVLDLFAGTGNLSFEFISRGVQSCIAVDKDPGCVRFMKATLSKLAPEASMQVIQADALRYLTNCLNRFDIIVADPPYAITPAAELNSLVFSRNLLNPEGVFILEHATEQNFSELPHFMESRKYGHVTFSFFGYKPNQEN
jgi:16S rRNA (guanine(966)-N(2))-methyltransferase RsmD